MFSYPPVKKVSVVIPVYNEQESLPELIRRTDTACATLGRQYEILLVDDGSSDDSARMLTEAAEAEGSHVVAGPVEPQLWPALGDYGGLQPRYRRPDHYP